MNRKIAITIVIISLLVVTAICFIMLYSQNRTRLISEKQYLFLNIEDIEGRLLDNELAVNKGTLMVFFNTQCDLCLEEIPLLKANLNRIEKKYNLIFISFEPKSNLSSFFKGYDITCTPGLFIISDEKYTLLNRYKIDGYPSLLVFDKQGIEVKRGSVINEGLLNELLRDEY